MQRLSTFNKLFILFCLMMVAFIIWKAPREKETSSGTPVEIMGEE
jgi:hypothetical protein